MARLIDTPNRELQPLIRALSDAGFTDELAALLRKPGNAEKAVELLKKQFQPEEGSEVAPAPVTPSTLLRLLSEGQEVVIPACDGKATLAKARDLFGYIDSDFKNWKTDKAGEATEATKVSVYELIEDATFTRMFTSLAQDVNKLCLTQAQIKEFVCTHRNWLRTDGYATFFLFRCGEEFFVAVVYFYSVGDLKVYVYHFEHDNYWFGEYRPRLVVSQL